MKKSHMIPLVLLVLAVVTFALNAHFSWHLFEVLPNNYGNVSIGTSCTLSDYICPVTIASKNVIRCDIWTTQYGVYQVVATLNPGQQGGSSSYGGSSCAGYAIVLKQAICGNSIVEGTEQCDPPGSKQACTVNGQSGTQTCSDSCLNSTCVVQACIPGQISCQGNSVVTCSSDGMNWINPSPCPTSCSNNKCTVCSPGATQSQACGSCGTQAKTCDSTGQWGVFGTCQNQGCAPTTSQSCTVNGIPGQQTCNNNCQWGTCQQTGVCVPGTTQACGNCGTKTCSQMGIWGACTPTPSQCGSGFTCS